MLEKINRGPLFYAAAVILVGTLGFGLGRLSKIREIRQPVRIEPAASARLVPEARPAPPAVQDTLGGRVVASKTGERYHWPWCSGAQRIKEENKVWFDSPEAAKKAGYTPAANCQGLK